MIYLVKPVLFLILVLISSSNILIQAQSDNTISLNKLGKKYPLYKGFQISIHSPIDQKNYEFTIGDSVSWLISNEALLKAEYYKMKSELTDTLRKIIEKENQNLLQQKDETVKMLNLEMKTNDKFMDLLKEDRSIAQESLNLVNKVKLKAGIITTIVSLGAGLLWMRKDDEVWLNVLKVVGCTGVGLLISFNLY